MKLSLSPPTADDLGDLLDFEARNRAFFEAHINARPVGYYSVAGVGEAIESARQDASLDRAYQYLVRDSDGFLVARVNLSRVRREHFHSAELGYRVGQAATGKGYAHEAVRQAVSKAFCEHALMRIEATSRPENAASVRVLHRAGFSQFGHSKRSFELGGVSYDLLHFDLRAGP